MSEDIDRSAPAESTGEPTDLREIAAEIGQRRAAAAVAAEYDPPKPEPEQPEPTARKPVVGDGKSDLSHRQAARGLAEWRAAEEARAAAYRQGLADPASAWAANAANQASPRSVADPAGEARAEGAIAAERAQLEQERLFYQQQHEAAQKIVSMSATEQALAQTLQQGIHEFTNVLYPDVRTAADVAQLQATDPARYEAYVNTYNALVAGVQNLQQAEQQRTQEYSTAFQRQAQAWDNQFSRSHPEWASNPAKQREMAEEAQRYFGELGVSNEELLQHWHGQKSFSIREPITQAVVFDALQWRLANQRLKQTQTDNRNNKPLPAVQRPGVAAERVDSGQQEWQRALKQNAQNPHSVKSGAAMIAAARAAGRLRMR